jgi:hypothetical protein
MAVQKREQKANAELQKAKVTASSSSSTSISASSTLPSSSSASAASSFSTPSTASTVTSSSRQNNNNNTNMGLKARRDKVLERSRRREPWERYDSDEEEEEEDNEGRGLGGEGAARKEAELFLRTLEEYNRTNDISVLQRAVGLIEKKKIEKKNKKRNEEGSFFPASSSTSTSTSSTSPSFVPFMGAGRALASDSSPYSSSPMNIASPPTPFPSSFSSSYASAARTTREHPHIIDDDDEVGEAGNGNNGSGSGSEFVFNQEEPHTEIQFRLHNGSRIVGKFNLTHSVADIRKVTDDGPSSWAFSCSLLLFSHLTSPHALTSLYWYVRFPQWISRVHAESSNRDYDLLSSSSFPAKPLRDETQTIQQAALKNAMVIQKLK